VGLDEHRASESEHGGIVGEDPDHVGAALELLVDRSNGLVDQILVQCAGGKAAKAVRSSRPSASIVATAGNLGASMAATLPTWSTTSWPVGCAKIVRMAAATSRLSPWPPGQHVAEEVDPAALPAGAGHDRDDGLLEPGVGVGDHQLDAMKPASLQAAQERGPEGTVFGVAHVQAEHLPAAISSHAGGDHHRAGDHPAVHPGLEVGGVHEQVREGGVASERDRNAATSASSSAQIRETSDLEIPASTPRALTRSSTLRVEVPCT
jgi:hypothetical protein